MFLFANPARRALLAAALPAVALLAAPTGASAKNVEANYDQVLNALQDAGYRAQVEGTGADRYVESAAGGYSFGVFFYGCDDGGDGCKTVQFYSAFSPEAKPTLEQINGYSAKHRWGRVYLDDEGDPVIEMDVNLEDGGMSPDLFGDNIEYWVAVLDNFAEWVFSPDER